MREHDVVAALGVGGIERDGPDDAGVRMGEADEAITPSTGERGQMPRANGRGAIFRREIHRGEWRLAGEGKRGVDDVFDIRGRETQVAHGVGELVVEFLELNAEVALELEHLARGIGVALGFHRIERATLTEHGFLDLIGDDGADFAQRSSRMRFTFSAARMRNSRSPSSSPGARPGLVSSKPAPTK